MHLIGGTYASLLPNDMRSARGVYYTPRALVSRLMDAATEAGIDWATCRVLDPASGSGAFLVPVAQRMAQAVQGADSRVILRNLKHRLRGFEIDPIAAWLSTVFLDIALHEVLGFTDEQLVTVDVCDTMLQHAGADIDLVIGNPPYGRVKLAPDLRAKYSRSLFGHANLYGIFIDIAVRHAKPGGLIAYVAPTSFLCGEYFKRLRALLAEEAPPIELDFVADRSGVFEGVLQETLLAVFKKGKVRTSARVCFVEATGSQTVVFGGTQAPLPLQREQPWIIARSASSAPLVARLRTMPNRLADWGYSVSTGPLVWNRFKNRLRDTASESTVPLIWAESVTSDGLFSFRAARRNHSPYFDVRDGDHFLLVRRPCILAQRTTSKEQSRRLVAAELPASFIRQHKAVTVENHLNMLVPRSDGPYVPTKVLSAFLNSRAADQVFRCISGTVAVSAFELQSMPLPPPDSLTRLSEILGRAHTSDEVERECFHLIGIEP